MGFPPIRILILKILKFKSHWLPKIQSGGGCHDAFVVLTPGEPDCFKHHWV